VITKKCDGIGIVGVNTHAFPYEPGFVLWPEVGEFPESGGLVSSSGALYIDGQVSSSLSLATIYYRVIRNSSKRNDSRSEEGLEGAPTFFRNLYISSQGTALLFYVNAAQIVHTDNRLS
jgi:hypothetical protein